MKRTTKGIIPYIQQHQNKTMSVSEFDYDEFLEMMEKVFQYIPSDSPKMVMCVHCGDAVVIPDNCSCGRMQDLYEKLSKLSDDAK